ncbi:hypothetical protein IC582_022491 [Cucumis melo]
MGFEREKEGYIYIYIYIYICIYFFFRTQKKPGFCRYPFVLFHFTILSPFFPHFNLSSSRTRISQTSLYLSLFLLFLFFSIFLCVL